MSEGLVESLAGIWLQYTLSCYSHDWSLLNNTLVVYLAFYLQLRSRVFLALTVLAVWFCMSDAKEALLVHLACHYVVWAPKLLSARSKSVV